MSTEPGSTEPGRRSRLLPWWAAGLGAVAVVAAGGYLGGGYFPAAIATGCVLAALLAERSAFFAVLAQPPLITAAVMTVTVLLGKPLLAAVLELSATFPYLLATMAAVVLVVAFRAFRGRIRT